MSKSCLELKTTVRTEDCEDWDECEDLELKTTVRTEDPLFLATRGITALTWGRGLGKVACPQAITF